MPNARRQLAEAELEAELVALASRLDYPPTPDLAARVRARLDAAPRRGSRSTFVQGRPFHLAAGIAIVVLLVTGVTLALSPRTRNAVADLLGLRGVRIHLVPSLPTPSQPNVMPVATTPQTGASSSTSPPGTASPLVPAASTVSPAVTASTVLPTATPSAGSRLGFGQAVTLDEARARLPFPILLPTSPELGSADEVYAQDPPARAALSLVYLPRPNLPASAQSGVGALFTEFRATVQPDFFGKLVGPDTRVEPVSVNGGRGWWLEGAPHGFFYTDASGQAQPETLRLAGNTLLWEQGGLTLRLEAPISKDEALRIAASVK